MLLSSPSSNLCVEPSRGDGCVSTTCIWKTSILRLVTRKTRSFSTKMLRQNTAVCADLRRRVESGGSFVFPLPPHFSLSPLFAKRTPADTTTVTNHTCARRRGGRSHRRLFLELQLYPTLPVGGPRRDVRYTTRNARKASDIKASSPPRTAAKFLYFCAVFLVQRQSRFLFPCAVLLSTISSHDIG